MANRQKAVKMASRGASPNEIRQATGVTAQAARNIVSRAAPSPAPTPSPTPAPVQTNAGPNPMGTPAPTKPTTLNQGLKIAGTGGITKQELSTLSDTTGKSGEKIVQRLDALNQKLKGKDQVGISLNSGAANMLIKRAQKASTRNPFMMPTQFGTGQIGKALQGMLGTPGSAGYMRQGQMVGGRQGIPGTGLMMGGTAIRPGGRPTVRGFGKQFGGMPTSNDLPTPPPDTTPPPEEITPVDTVEPMIPEELPEEKGPDQIMPGSSADLANWATGFRRKGSSRKGAGARAQGLGSQRVNPSGTFRGGM
jgi:hypothetical protein